NCNTREEFFRYDRKGYDFFSKLLSHDKTVLSESWSNCPNTAAPTWTVGDPNPYASPITRALASTPPLDAIAVPLGTAISEITLPAKVQVAYTNSYTEGLPVPWDTLPYGLDRLPVNWDTSSYNGEVAGTYTIEGTIHATYMGLYATGVITNPGNVKAIITVEVIPDADYTVYMESAQTGLEAGETLYVDVMLKGGINYTQINTGISYDGDLLEFAGHENLGGLVAEVKKDGADKISLRSVPSLNMMAGVSCDPPFRVVTLKFTVKDSFTAASVDTNLSLISTVITPVAGVSGVTLDIGKPLSITFYKPEQGQADFTELIVELIDPGALQLPL
ncbi:MAG: Ig-like domain-containing protein, partial [Clostridiales bacterium]|nr:Ig-like domain-containing protein [Clostridiales bacterium]